MAETHAALIARLQIEAADLSLQAAELRAVPDGRPFEDGSRLNLHLRIARCDDQAQLLRDAILALHAAEQCGVVCPGCGDNLQTLKPAEGSLTYEMHGYLWHAKCAVDLHAAGERETQLTQALRLFGRHEGGCPARMMLPCNCGLVAFLPAPPVPEQE